MSVGTPFGVRLGALLSVILAAAATPPSAARSAELQQKSPQQALAGAVATLRPVFASAGPPNFQTGVDAEMDSAGSVKARRAVVIAASNAIVSLRLSERQMLASHSRITPCTLEGSAAALFAGLQVVQSSARTDCAGAYLDVEGRLTAVTDVAGLLFPLENGNELRFAMVAKNAMIDLFPQSLHRMTVSGVLEGVTLNVTGMPDVIYLIRNEETYLNAAKPLVTDIYWSTALRWPIQARLRTEDGAFTFVERDLIHVSGVMPYVLPDGRAISDFDDRTTLVYSVEDIDRLARKLRDVASGQKKVDIDVMGRAAGQLIDATALPGQGLPPAFASIAPFVTAAAGGGTRQ